MVERTSERKLDPRKRVALLLGTSIFAATGAGVFAAAAVSDAKQGNDFGVNLFAGSSLYSLGVAGCYGRRLAKEYVSLWKENEALKNKNELSRRE